MSSKVFLKIWTGLLSSFALFSSDSEAYVQTFEPDSKQNNNMLIINKSKSPDLFLRQAKDEYSNSILFAGHRSHSSHRSHYSSRSGGTYVPPATTQPSVPKTYTPPTSTPKKTISPNTTDIKMIQLSLNLLGYKAGKVNGNVGTKTKSALMQFQMNQNLSSSGKVDGQTCLYLAREAKNKFPGDEKVKQLHDNLLNLYMRLIAP